MIDSDNDYLDAVEAQLVELTERGAHRRLRPRSAARFSGGGQGRGPQPTGGALAFAAAILIMVAVVLVALGTLHPAPRSEPTAGRAGRNGHVHTGVTTRRTRPGRAGKGATSPTGGSKPAAGGGLPSGPVPPGFAPTSFTAISELTWWLLGNAPCSRPPCTSIVRTTDGGQSFAGIPAPRAPLAGSDYQAGVGQLRFADSDNGFAYGGSLYTTHDAGASWHEVRLGGWVTDLAIADGEVYAVVTADRGSPGRLMRSPVNQDRWVAVTAAGGVLGGLWARGADVLVESATGSRGGSYLLVSHDAGTSFAKYPAPPNISCQFQAPAPPAVWAECVTGMMSGVLRSTDYGANFAFATGGGPGEQANSAAFAAASATTAVVGERQLYRTTDGGARYAPVGPAGISWWQYLGFTDATHGVALGYLGSEIPAHERLYYTTDAGLSYHLVPIA